MESDPLLIYTACGCNRSPHCMDWGWNGKVAFGVCNAVAVWRFKSDPNPSTFCLHKWPVKSVRWVRDNGSREKELISTSVDGTGIVWSFSSDGNTASYAILDGHTNVVHSADGIYVSPKISSQHRRGLVVATSSVDCTVKIWIRKEGQDTFADTQTLCFGSASCLCARLEYFPSSKHILLACACDDGRLYLYHGTGTARFTNVLTLDGHKDFVTSVDITVTDVGNLALLTGSQDGTVRVWKLWCRSKDTDAINAADCDVRQQIFMRSRDFSIPGQQYISHLESILHGYSTGVQCVSWHPGFYSETGKKLFQPMLFLSASTGHPPILYGFKESDDLWDELTHFDTGDDGMGALVCGFQPNGPHVIFQGYHGSRIVCRLNYLETDPKTLPTIWEHTLTLSGHTGAVVDLQWEPDGEYLFSVSKDKTTSVHAPWFKSKIYGKTCWHQVAWPQVHGYDMACIAVLSRYTFASGADEKVIRVFEAPQTFIDNVKKRSPKTLLDKAERRESKTSMEYKIRFVPEVGGGSTTGSEKNTEKNLPIAASLPPLGLSNKAVFKEGGAVEEASGAASKKEDEPPGDEMSKLTTLWPEIHKLYRHGNEICALAAHPHGKYLASACKASTSEDAAITLWNTNTWAVVQEFSFHSHSVTRMAFAPNGAYLLAVSRDRRWSLYQQTGATTGAVYQLLSHSDYDNGIHTRVIWTCCWTHESSYFVTGSRDGKVVCWIPCADPPETLGQFQFKNKAVTALAMPSSPFGDNYVIAVGFDSGVISIFAWKPHESNWRELVQMEQNYAHHLAVKQLAFRPTNPAWLASCGEDHLVKIYDLTPTYIFWGLTTKSIYSLEN